MKSDKYYITITTCDSNGLKSNCLFFKTLDDLFKSYTEYISKDSKTPSIVSLTAYQIHFFDDKAAMVNSLFNNSKSQIIFNDEKDEKKCEA